MKVRIGKPPSTLRSRIHISYMQKKYGFVWPEKQTGFERGLEKVEDFLDILYTPINYFLEKRTQKVKVSIDSWDTWDMSETLAYIVVPMLRQLKETKHGAPFVDNADVPEWLRMPDNWYEKYSRNGETDPHFFDRWDWVMDEMIWAFEQNTIDWEDQYYTYKEGANDGFLGGYRIEKVDDEGLQQHRKRMEEGMRLFGKYYGSLWD